MMEPTCNRCHGDLRHGEYRVVVTHKNEVVMELTLCKKCVKKLMKEEI